MSGRGWEVWVGWQGGLGCDGSGVGGAGRSPSPCVGGVSTGVCPGRGVGWPMGMCGEGVGAEPCPGGGWGLALWAGLHPEVDGAYEMWARLCVGNVWGWWCGRGLVPERGVACLCGRGKELVPGGAAASSCLWRQGQLGGSGDACPALQAGALVLPLHCWPLRLLQVLGPRRWALR